LMIARVVALVIIFAVLLAIASSITTPPEVNELFTQEQVSRAASVLPIVSLIMALWLTYLAVRSRWHGWKLAVALSTIFYGVYTFLGWIELLAFPAVVGRMPAGMISGLLVSGLILIIPFSLLLVWILGKTRKDPAATEANDRLQMPTTEWIWKLAAAAIFYVIVYFTFGYYIAWRTPTLPEFYGGTDPGTFSGQLASVAREAPWLYPFQFLRGLIWAGIGCLLLRMHKGRALEAALATGLTFTIVMSAPLLFPNPFMPPAIARAHSIELASSNFVYGTLLSALMLWRPSRTN